MRWRPFLLILMTAAAGCAGCVERRFTVVSDPPGAMVLADRQEVGAAPVTLPTRAATYYGTREFMLVKDGFEPLLVRQPIPGPWYGYFPLDFFAEHLWPGTIRDERVFTYHLSPQKNVPPETTLQSGNNMRARAAGIGPTSPPAPAAVPAPAPNGLPPGALPAQPAVPASPPSDSGAPGRVTGLPTERQ